MKTVRFSTKVISLWLILFLLITNIQFKGFPFSTREVVGIFAIFYFLCNHKKANRLLFIGIVLYISLILMQISVSILNSHFDFSVLLMLCLRIILLFTAFYIWSNFNSYTLPQIIKIILSIVLLNDILALLLFLNPSMNQFILSIQKMSDADILFVSSGMRFQGIGLFRYFEGGIINAVAIILTLYLFSIRELNVIKSFILILVFLFLGIFIARSTLLGLIGFIYVFYPSSPVRKGILGIISLLVVFSLISFFSLSALFSDTPLLNWAFEAFYNYLESDELRTTSTDGLKAMYIYPENIYTWIYGDGIWTEDDHYYMRTDVGYLRMIFYWGIIGTIMFYSSIIYLSYYAVRKSSTYNKYLIANILLLILIANFKGFTDVVYILFPILFFIKYSRKSNRIINENFNSCSVF